MTGLRFLLAVGVCVLASACAGTVATEAVPPCDGLSYSQLVGADIPCDQTAPPPACGFDENFQPTTVGSACMSYLGSCADIVWNVETMPAQKSPKGGCGPVDGPQ